MNIEQLFSTAKAMVAPGKGLLAADESIGTATKRLESVGVESTEENRRLYREMLFTANDIEQYFSGVILFDETIRQSTSDGVLFREYLSSRGIMPGIKVDTGAKDMDDKPGEKLTSGLDGLAERFAEYAEMGAKFSKWRMVVVIGDGLPTDTSLKANADALAKYAKAAQEAGIVPIVEPEVLMDGRHDIQACYDATARANRFLFAALKEHGVLLEGTILKPNMVVSGKDAAEQADVQTVAEWTIKCLKENVPQEVAGIMFLSGGQSEEKATEHLNAMNTKGELPWPLSFSYGRALQAPALAIWGADQSNIKEAQAALIKRAKLNSLAAKGEYDSSME